MLFVIVILLLMNLYFNKLKFVLYKIILIYIYRAVKIIDK